MKHHNWRITTPGPVLLACHRLTRCASLPTYTACSLMHTAWALLYLRRCGSVCCKRDMHSYRCLIRSKRRGTAVGCESTLRGCHVRSPLHEGRANSLPGVPGMRPSGQQTVRRQPRSPANVQTAALETASSYRTPDMAPYEVPPASPGARAGVPTLDGGPVDVSESHTLHVAVSSSMLSRICTTACDIFQRREHEWSTYLLVLP